MLRLEECRDVACYVWKQGKMGNTSTSLGVSDGEE